MEQKIISNKLKSNTDTNYYLLLYFCNVSYLKITVKCYKLTCRLNSLLYCDMFDKTDLLIYLILQIEHLLTLVLTKVELELLISWLVHLFKMHKALGSILSTT